MDLLLWWAGVIRRGSGYGQGFLKCKILIVIFQTICSNRLYRFVPLSFLSIYQHFLFLFVCLEAGGGGLFSQ